MVVDIPDVITSANFGEDRLRGLGVARGQNLPFSIDFDRRPYNTLALRCECVIENFVKFERAVFDICELTDRQADIQTDVETWLSQYFVSLPIATPLRDFATKYLILCLTHGETGSQWNTGYSGIFAISLSNMQLV